MKQLCQAGFWTPVTSVYYSRVAAADIVYLALTSDFSSTFAFWSVRAIRRSFECRKTVWAARKV